LSDVFTNGSYEPLAVIGPHRDHVIAFARRHGRDAVVIAVAKSFSAFSQGGRVWPGADKFDAALDMSGYAVEGFAEADATQIRLSNLFGHLPTAVLKARFTGSAKPARKLVRA
jgi:(1->4)-alpha-D-glucan 1-alpha-D-glucosylmutase